MANQPSPVLNIRGSCMVQKPSHIWMLFFEWLQSQQYESSHCPHPPLQALPPLCMAALPSPIWKRTLVWLNYHTYFKKQRETCMVQKPSHVNQLSPIHMCKIGVNKAQNKYILGVPQYLSTRPNWDPPSPLPQGSVSHPKQRGRGDTLACGWKGWGVPIRTTGEYWSTLSTLWVKAWWS